MLSKTRWKRNAAKARKKTREQKDIDLLKELTKNLDDTPSFASVPSTTPGRTHSVMLVLKPGEHLEFDWFGTHFDIEATK